MIDHELAELLLRRGAGFQPRAPAAPRGFHVQTPANDDPGLIDASTTTTLHDLIGRKIGLRYVDSLGQESTRRILIRAIGGAWQNIRLQAFCYERMAPREFVLSRVKEFINLDTGEIFDDASEFLNSLAPSRISQHPRDLAAQAVFSCRKGINILVFLARVDGLHPSEHITLVNYVLDSPGTSVNADVQEVERHVLSFHPDLETYSRSARGFLFGGRDEIRRVARYIRRLVDADGVLSEAEFHFVEEFERLA
jgi:hypothetical protein